MKRSSRNIAVVEYGGQPGPSAQAVLREQLQWLVRLRWVAVAVIVIGAVAGSAIFPVLATSIPLYCLAGVLLLCNVGFYLIIGRWRGQAGRRETVAAMLQVEVDLVILTALLHFSGGVMNPFVLFYVFHVIIATIILPRTLSYSVGLSAIGMYGMLAVGELEGWFWLRHHPLQLSSSGALWNDPVYVLWVVAAFVGMVVLSQYLTTTVITRVRAKEREIDRINEMLRRSQIEMAEREKMVAIGQMASGVAHEIGNPLNSLSSVVQYLGRKIAGKEEKKQLDIIDQQVNRISGILRRLLGMARPAESESTWLDVNQVIEDTLALVKYDGRAREVDIESTPDTDLPTVWLRRQNVEQALLNVFLNALDAMAADTAKPQHRLEVNRIVREGMIEIRISDTGPGMAEEVQARAFEPFFTTKEAGKGTGLGLYVSRQLIEETGGTIEIKCNQGPGVTVVTRLPIGPADDVAGTARNTKDQSVPKDIMCC